MMQCPALLVSELCVVCMPPMHTPRGIVMDGPRFTLHSGNAVLRIIPNYFMFVYRNIIIVIELRFASTYIIYNNKKKESKKHDDEELYNGKYNFFHNKYYMIGDLINHGIKDYNIKKVIFFDDYTENIESLNNIKQYFFSYATVYK